MAILKGIISKLNGSAGNLTFKQLGGPLALRAFQRLKPVPIACGGPFALRAFQVESEALFQKPEGRSRWFQRPGGRVMG